MKPSTSTAQGHKTTQSLEERLPHRIPYAIPRPQNRYDVLPFLPSAPNSGPPASSFLPTVEDRHKQFAKVVKGMTRRLCNECLDKRLGAPPQASTYFDLPQFWYGNCRAEYLEPVIPCQCNDVWEGTLKKNISLDEWTAALVKFPQKARNERHCSFTKPWELNKEKKWDRSLRYACINAKACDALVRFGWAFGFRPQDVRVFYTTFPKIWEWVVREGDGLWRAMKGRPYVPVALALDAMTFMKSEEWGCCSCRRVVNWDMEYWLACTADGMGRRLRGWECLGCDGWTVRFEMLGPVGPRLLRALGYNHGAVEMMYRIGLDVVIAPKKYLGWGGEVERPVERVKRAERVERRDRLEKAQGFVVDSKAFEEEEEQIREILRR
jgi:hypothetical protein